jgi:FkbM family methyltransferase
MNPTKYIRPHGLNSVSRNPLFATSGMLEVFKDYPLGFIDIGARGGIHELVEPVAEIVSVLGFEPDRIECVRMLGISDLTSPWDHFHLIPIGLDEEAGTQKLYLLEASTNHSILKPNLKFTHRYKMSKFNILGNTEIEVETLDNILLNKKYEINSSFRAEFIKLDTQGSEFEILKGATKVLKSECFVIVCEVSFCEIYKDQKLFSEVEIFLRELGFTFYGFGPQHQRSTKAIDKKEYKTSERLIYADAYFFKDPIINPQVDLRSSRVVFLGALLLGFYDFCMEICNVKPHIFSHINDAKSLIMEVANHSIQQSISEVKDLVSSIESQPEMANILIGSFVSERRLMANYDDVLNISPLPNSL